MQISGPENCWPTNAKSELKKLIILGNYFNILLELYRTFLMIKPEAKEAIGEIISILEENKFQITQLKMLKLQPLNIVQFCGSKVSDSSIPFLLENLTSGPVVVSPENSLFKTFPKNFSIILRFVSYSVKMPSSTWKNFVDQKMSIKQNPSIQHRYEVNLDMTIWNVEFFVPRIPIQLKR